MTLPVGQDKPEFVKRRVRKLLMAGVVSALACMVKSENPALTNSCRELISRCGCARNRTELSSQAAPILLVNSCACDEGQLLDSRGDNQESGAAWAHCDCPSAATSPTWSLECSWRWWRRQKTGVVWLHREEAR